MYKIIGADGREYGPVGADELRQWVQEGRANAQSRVCAEGSTEWRALTTYPEFATALAAIPAVPPPMTPSRITVTRSPIERTNGLAIGGFVCSLISFPAMCLCPLVFSILGLVLSIVAINQIKRDPHLGGNGIATAGIIISICTLLLSAAVWTLFLMGLIDDTNTVFK